MQATTGENIIEDNKTNNKSEAKSSIISDRDENGCSKRKSMSPEQGERKTKRKSYVEVIESATQIAKNIYKTIEEELEGNECSNDLIVELESTVPHFRMVFSKWRNDLEKTDHGIVVAGETSCGKSTLINKILGIKLFKGKLVESTSTICKIRNSDQIKIITTKKTEEVIEKDLSHIHNPLDKEGVRELRRYLKDRTDLTHMSPDILDFQTVDILLPVPFLKGNTILVDTPGIGGSGKVTQKLIEYLPNALAFIFVIDVSSAGGMQKDRLPDILQKIETLQKQSDMPCFNPKNVVFVTNKWDLVRKQIDSSDEDNSGSDEEQEPKIWKKLQTDIKHKWPSVREENIFKMILKDVSSRKKNDSTTSFKDFQKILDSLVKKAEDLRVVEHLSFLEDTLTNISKGINIRIKFSEKSKKEQEEMHEENKKEIKKLKNECTEVKKKYETIVKGSIDAIIQECETYMSTDEGKYSILNPAGRVSIANINWNKTNFEARIKSRVDLYILHFLQSKSVVKRYEDIVKEIQTFYNQVISSIKKMEGMPVDINPLDDKDTAAWTNFREISMYSSPFWLTAIAFTVSIPVAIVSGCAFAVLSFLTRVSKTTKDIDDEYKKCKSTVPTVIRTDLQERFDVPIGELIGVVTKDLLKLIEKTEKRNEIVWKERDKFEAHRDSLKKLDEKIPALMETVKSLCQKLKVSKVNE